MESNQAFALESDSPADREAKLRESRRTSREATARKRAAARAAGQLQVAVTLPGSQVKAIDAYQRDENLENRSAAAARIIAAGLPAVAARRDRRTATQSQLVSVAVPPEDMAAIERIKAAKGLATESDAIGLLISLARDPRIQQELGL